MRPPSGYQGPDLLTHQRGRQEGEQLAADGLLVEAAAKLLEGADAGDIIGTLVKAAEPHGFTSYMVTPDKDFGQLVTDKTLLWRPGRQGGEVGADLGGVRVAAPGIGQVQSEVETARGA